MQEHARPWLPAWAVVLVALCIPLVIAFGFLVVFDMANPPISGIGYESDPSIGQRIASRNDALIFLHAVAQGGFLLFGGVIAPSHRTRMLFLLIAGPISGLALLITFIGLLAG
jgi:hypothetical protein